MKSDSRQENDKMPEKRRAALKFGKIGETMAARYLSEKGYKILEHNYRRGHLEIDIIALDNNELVIVEVKSRNNEAVIHPEDAVGHKKRQALIRLANEYVISHNRKENVRFDIITVISPQGADAATPVEALFGDGAQGVEIKHLKDAYNVMSF